MGVFAGHQHLRAPVGFDPPKLPASRSRSAAGARLATCGWRWLELRPGRALELIDRYRDATVDDVNGRDLVARQIAHDGRASVRSDAEKQGRVARTCEDVVLAVGREGHHVRRVRRVELLGLADAIDGEDLPLRAGGREQLPTLLVVEESPDVFGALGTRKAFRLARLRIDSIDVAVRQSARVECPVAAEC